MENSFAWLTKGVLDHGVLRKDKNIWEPQTNVP
jgi:hypothetical protein